MELSEIILEKIKDDHRGKENAITRKKLLSYCNSYAYRQFPFFIGSFTDRQLRIVYSQLPVVTCEQGIYWPIRDSEITEFREYLQKKAIPLFERWKKVADAHLSDDKKQMELF